MSASRRQHSKEFKLQVLREVEAGKPIAQASREHNVHPTLITKWRAALQKHGGHAFAGNGNAYTSEAKIAELERLIGQLTVENAVLKKALAKLEARPSSQIVSGKR